MQTTDQKEKVSSVITDFDIVLRVLSGLCDGQNGEMQVSVFFFFQWEII